MTRKVFFLVHDQARRSAAEYCRTAPEGLCVEFKERTRTLEQNSLLWPLLNEISKQVVWHGQKLSDEDWKDMLTASLSKQRVAPGIDGGFVVFGERTKTYSKAMFSELIELCYAFGTQHGVKFKS